MMKAGDTLHNFNIIDVVELKELKAQGIWARHASGAELFHVVNSDPENLFAFAFSTAAENSMGAAHILEHSVLCGSEKYPLKDAFLTLAQGSLSTFLNAWTFPDKTVYPASSENEKDYFNLMSVYADAVFRPLLSEWTFLQEGWRLVPGKGKGFEYTGVVYNEMKGAYSSADTYAGLWSVKGVMPGTPYAFESGGDPDCIPDLDWEGLKEFHRSRYMPANCRIFLAGNIPTEKQMLFLDSLFSDLPAGTPVPAIAPAARWNVPQKLHIPCPAGDEGQKPQAFLSWLCSDSTDSKETMALSCLAEILLGHDGSPLTRALVESGLGEDIAPSTGLECELRETVFSAGLRGINGEKGGVRSGKNPNSKTTYRRMENLIMDELRRLVKKGIPKEEIDAALLSIEFSHREIKRSGGPYSLVWMRRSLRGWLYGTKPWDSLLFEPSFSALKRRLAKNKRYFESLVEKYLLDNPHRALIVLEPRADYLAKKEAALAERLLEKEQALSEPEKKTLAEKAAGLEKFQTAGDSKTALASIPHLSRRDLLPAVEAIPTEFQDTAGPPAMLHPLFTNGISYADLAFPVDILDPGDYPWLPFFARAVISMGLPGMDYGEVSGLLARTAGGFYALLESGSSALPNSESACKAGPACLGGSLDSCQSRDWIVYRIKALDEKLPAALDLARRLMTEADFSDLRRLKDLAAEMKNDADSSLAPSGHNYASLRSGIRFSRARAVDELWNGLGQLPFAHHLAAMDMGELRDRMIRIRDTLLSGGLLVNLTAEVQSLPGALRAIKPFASFGAPRRANPQGSTGEAFLSLVSREMHSVRPEVYVSPSLQVGFAALSLPAAPYGSPEQAAELVLSHELSTGALWESIRMMGGAYGAFAHPDSLEGVFSFSTYRDPDPLRSLNAFPAILKKRSRTLFGKSMVNEETLEKTIIGAYARETRPHTPAEKGFSEFLRRLYGINDSHRLAKLQYMTALRSRDTSAAARRLADAAHPGTGGQQTSFPVIIAGTTTAEQAAKQLGVDVKELPV